MWRRAEGQPFLDPSLFFPFDFIANPYFFWVRPCFPCSLSVFQRAIRRNYWQNGKTFPTDLAASVITVPTTASRESFADLLFYRSAALHPALGLPRNRALRPRFRAILRVNLHSQLFARPFDTPPLRGFIRPLFTTINAILENSRRWCNEESGIKRLRRIWKVGISPKFKTVASVSFYGSACRGANPVYPGNSCSCFSWKVVGESWILGSEFWEKKLVNFETEQLL